MVKGYSLKVKGYSTLRYRLKVLFVLFTFHLVGELVEPSLFTPTQSVAQCILYPQHFDMSEVELLDGPMRTAMVTNAELLLKYDADRLMCPFIREAGLSSEKSSKYYGWTTKHPSFGNWGQADWSLEGHVGGHYVSALALSYAATKADTSLKDLNGRLMERLTYCLGIMKDCQDAYKGNKEGMEGFIGGQPITHIWKGLYRNDPSGFYQYGGWVPFYCQHKVLAGLRDAYIYAGSEMAKELFRGLADWSVNVVKNLSAETMQNVLNSEHGGMNETIADAYKIFGDAKYLTAAKKYSHQSMVSGMQTLNTTFLNNRHANTQVPKYIGFERIYQVGGMRASDNTYKKAARNFWTDVAENRTVCIGGNSVEEHFLNQSNYVNYVNKLDGPETCNSNNMMKLSEDLFDDTHDSRYADFYENTMYNHILSTQDPETGGYVYFTTLRPQGYKIYSKVNQGMWCCVGTGMENHAKYSHFIYTHDNDTLFVNLFTASELKNERFGIRQETKFPYEQKSTITITKAGNYTIAVRNPSWTGKSGYTKYSQEWKTGDKIEINLPMTLRYEQCPGLDEYIAFKYGPILLAATTGATDLQNEYAGEGRMDHAPGSRASSKSLLSSPLLICERDTVMNLFDSVTADSRLQFTVHAPAYIPEGSMFRRKSTLTLQPFFSTHHDRYVIYWYQQNEEAFLTSDIGRKEREREELDNRTIDFVGTGEQQSEAGHKAKYSSGSTKGSYNGEFYRDAQTNGYIQYTLSNPDQISENLSIMCRFTTADRGRAATIYVDGTRLTTVTIPSSISSADDNGFFNADYPLPESLVRDKDGNVKKEFVFRITANQGTICPGLYYLRLLKDYKNEALITDYQFKAVEWAKTGDAGRVAQTNVSYDSKANTITVKAGTGANNVCLNMTDNKYRIGSDLRYFVVQGTNLRTTNGSSYLWWFNGTNHGSSVAPVKTSKSGDLVTIIWDLTTSGLNDNCVYPQYNFSQGNTIFGLTSTTGTSVISHIGFYADIEGPTAINLPHLSTPATEPVEVQPSAYNLQGQKVGDEYTGIVIQNGKKVLK